MTKKPIVTLIAALVWVFYINAQNDSIPTTQNDPNIKSVDSTRQGNKALPIAIPITEPAVGVGLTGGLMYFLPKKDSSEQVDMIVGGAGFTSNGSWLAGVGYLGYWNKDKVRYTGFSGYEKSLWIIMVLIRMNPLNSIKRSSFLCSKHLLD